MQPELARSTMKALESLVRAGGVHVVPVTDDGETRFHGTAGGRACSGEDLEDVILELAGRPRVQTCPRCGRTKPITQFARNEGREGGRNRYCRPCETRRLRKYKVRRKAAGRPAA